MTRKEKLNLNQEEHFQLSERHYCLIFLSKVYRENKQKLIQHSSACSAFWAQHRNKAVTPKWPEGLLWRRAHSVLTGSTSGWIVSPEGRDSIDFWNDCIQNKVIGYGSCMGLRTFKLVILFSTSDVKWACWLVFIILKYPRYLGRGVSIEELPLSD